MARRGWETRLAGHHQRPMDSPPSTRTRRLVKSQSKSILFYVRKHAILRNGRSVRKSPALN